VRLAALLPIVLLIAGCADHADGVSAYEARDYEGARVVFASVVERGGDGAWPDALYWLALASLRTGELDIAEEACGRAADADVAYVPLRDFVRGNIAFLRCETAAEQARSVEAEPFAFDVAIGHAEKARGAWARAAAARDDWPSARRNAERAWLRIESLRKEKSQAEKRRETKKAGGGPPKINLVQQPPQKTDDPGERADPQSADGAGDDSAREPELALAKGELAADQVLGVLETLRAKEDEKLMTRRARRLARSKNVERDW